MSNLSEYLESGEHLPKFLRDFHDQKDFFKSMHYLCEGSEGSDEKPNWVEGHIYTIDWFLWFMASRGYTLQKCRKKGIEFKELPDWDKLMFGKGERDE